MWIFFISLVCFSLIWSLFKAVAITDTKSIIAYSTISQISYMFLCVLFFPQYSLYHIIIHGLFKSLLFLLSGSLIHVQLNFQSIYKMRVNNLLIKISFILGVCVLILSLSKEGIIHSSYIMISSSWVFFVLIIGGMLTCFYSSRSIEFCFCFQYSVLTFYSSSIFIFFVSVSLIVDEIFEFCLCSFNYFFIFNLFNLEFLFTFSTFYILGRTFSLVFVFSTFNLFLFFFFKSCIFVIYFYFSFYSRSSYLISFFNNFFLYFLFFVFYPSIYCIEVLSGFKSCYSIYQIHYITCYLLICFFCLVMCLIEYFTYFNLWLVCLFFWMIFFVIFIFSNLFIFCSVFDIDGFIELLLSMVFVLILLIIIGSGFIILSNHSFYGMFCFKNYSVFISGIQWVWEVDYSQFDLDCVVIVDFICIVVGMFANYFVVGIWIVYKFFYFNSLIYLNNFYMFQSCEYEWLLPAGILCVFFVGSIDIVHSFGISCLGIRIDCIPGRINLVYELVKLNGKIRGFCYELCGQYHSNMVILGFSFFLILFCLFEQLVQYL